MAKTVQHIFLYNTLLALFRTHIHVTAISPMSNNKQHSEPRSYSAIACEDSEEWINSRGWLISTFLPVATYRIQAPGMRPACHLSAGRAKMTLQHGTDRPSAPGKHIQLPLAPIAGVHDTKTEEVEDVCMLLNTLGSATVGLRLGLSSGNGCAMDPSNVQFRST